MAPQTDIPVAANVLGTIGTVLWGWRTWTATLVVIAMGATFAAVEAALILTLRPLYEAGNETGVLVVGILASILLAAGLLPPYGEIWKRRGRVIGINWIFLSLDSGGAFFSLMALVAQNTFDILGGVLYIVCFVLELGIFLSQIIWLLRTRKVRKEAAAEGKTFDAILVECEEAGTPFRFAERRSRRKNKPGDSETSQNQNDVELSNSVDGNQ
ncbi:hypothetical protein TruAng_005442 [Truncatella angustata]|nr:hypothetical protein TruAng_005442 [Truncatella angustata]